MYVAAIDEHVLTGNVPRTRRDQKGNHVCNFGGRGHVLIQWDLGTHALQFLLGGRESVEPVLVKRRHHLGGHNCVNADSVGKKFCCPLTCHSKDCALRSDITRSPTLAGQGRFRTDIHNCSASFLQVRQRIVSHVVVVQQIASKRGDEFLWATVLESHLVVNASIVH